jgi:hypothetical protein
MTVALHELAICDNCDEPAFTEVGAGFFLCEICTETLVDSVNTPEASGTTRKVSSGSLLGEPSRNSVRASPSSIPVRSSPLASALAASTPVDAVLFSLRSDIVKLEALLCKRACVPLIPRNATAFRAAVASEMHPTAQSLSSDIAYSLLNAGAKW